MDPFIEGVLKGLGQKAVDAVTSRGSRPDPNSQAGGSTPSSNLDDLFNQGMRHMLSKPHVGIEYLRIAAEGGHAEAQACYGLFLRSGKGCLANWDDGTVWLNKAAQQGNERAIDMLAHERVLGNIQTIAGRVDDVRGDMDQKLKRFLNPS